MNIHVRACVQSVHHRHAHMISDGHASIDDAPVSQNKFASSVSLRRSSMSQVLFHARIAACITPQISKCKAHDDPGPLRWSYDTCDAIFGERELTFTFMFAICYRPSVCLSVVCLSSVTLVRPIQAVQIFGNVSTAFGTLAIQRQFYGDRPRGTPPSGELYPTGVAKYSDFGPIDGYILETVRERRQVSINH